MASREKVTYSNGVSQSVAQSLQPSTPARPDFDIWAAAVRTQMLAVLQKKSAQ
jgi:hypothetical protein